MFNIGIRINHGTFQGINMITNHNFVSSSGVRIGTSLWIDEWGVRGEVYQCTGRSPIKPLGANERILR